MGVEAGVDPPQHRRLGLLVGGVDGDLEEEAVELRLGQRVGALVLDRVLGGHHHEAIAERAGGAVGGDLALLHRLEQRGLGLRRGAVDLVGEQRVGEDRPRPELELGAVRAPHAGADDVRGEQVGGELQPGEPGVDGRRGAPRHQRLGRPGTPSMSTCPPTRMVSRRPSIACR